ncbi:MAG: Fe-S cluster assembly ATPase SufC [Candidatus Kerfeldbacteria bacterium]|nr:Fe-S cluster assembly ATPase SufC [Candidatus Kerfeldbacteria bacterium]
MSKKLNISDLHVEVSGKEILHGIDLMVNTGEVHAIMGPNGSGKSTLSQTIFGHPNYTVTKGSIRLDGKDLLPLSPDKRANLGLFLAFQSPNAVPGVNIASFLKQAVNAKRRFVDPAFKGLKIREYRELLEGTMQTIKMKPEFAQRYLNTGFSGGEKKKSEILQMAMLRPDIAVLDEIDSGLDVDALKAVCEGVNTLRRETGMGVLIITHYPRILKYIMPDTVHILMDGRIVRSGDHTLAHRIEEDGYDWLKSTEKPV